MSEENVALVRRIYAMINSVDAGADPEEADPELWARFSPDFEFHGRVDVPDATVRDREATKEFWRDLGEVFSEMRWEPGEFIDLGHAVVVETRLAARGRGSEVRVEENETDVFWF